MSRFEVIESRPPRSEPHEAAYGGYGYDGEAGPPVGGSVLLRALRRRWWMPLLVALVAFGAGWFFLPDSLPQYRAVAVIRMDDSRRALIGGLDAGTQDNIRSPEFMISQVHVIRSRTVVGDVVDAGGFRLLPSPELPSHLLHRVRVGSTAGGSMALAFFADGFEVAGAAGTVRAEYGELVEIDGVEFLLIERPAAPEATMRILTRDQAIDQIMGSLTAMPRDRAAIIDIAYTATDPRRAQAVVNAIAGAFREHNMRGARDAARRRREFIEGQWIQAEQRLATVQQRLADFRIQSQHYSPQERLRMEQAGLMDLDTRRSALQAERRLFQGFLARMEDASESEIEAELRTLVATPGLASSQLLTELHGQIRQHQGTREQLLARGLAPTHPEVERVNGLLSAARSSVVDIARTQLSSVDLRLDALRQQREQSTSTIRSLPESQAEELRLEQEVAAAANATESLRAEYQRARLAEAVDLGQAEILDLAALSTPVSAGGRVQNLSIVVLLGLMLGMTGAFVLESRDKSIRLRAEMEDLGALAGLAVIPRISVGPKGRRARLKARKNGGRDTAIAAADFHNTAAEAYRVLRTNLVFQDAGQRFGTLVVSSAGPGEGKTTTAANLATSFARQGLRVLLVDCDLRRPRLHRVFGMEMEPGFVDLLLGRAPSDTVVRPTAVENLYLLPRGSFNEAAAEMLGSPRVRSLLEQLRGQFDVVVVDTPPVLAAADAAALAAMVDGVLLVVRAGQTHREAAREALNQLHGVGAHLVGFVLNDPDSVAGRYDDYAYPRKYYAAEA